METKKRKPRLDNLDLLQTLGILMVIAAHAPLWNADVQAYDSPFRLAQYFMRLLSEGVPLLLMGFGCLEMGRSRMNLRRHLGKTGRLAVMLVVWGVVLAVVRGIVLDGVESLSIQTVAAHLLETDVGARYTAPLSFVQGLLSVYLAFPVLWWTCNSEYRIYRFTFCVVSFFTVGLSLLKLGGEVLSLYADPTLLNQAISFLSVPSPFATSAWYLFYFMLGGMLVRNQRAIRQRRGLFSFVGILAILLSMGCCWGLGRLKGAVYSPNFNYTSIFEPLWLAGIYALTLPYRNYYGPVGNFLRSVRNNALGIYIIQSVLTFLAMNYLTLDKLYLRAGEVLAVFLGSCLLGWVLSKIPLLNKLV